MDEKECVLLVLLNQSAPFDTVNHSVPLSRLENRLGITGTALAWFKSSAHQQEAVCPRPEGAPLGVMI